MLKRNRLHLALTALLTLSVAAPAFGQATSASMIGRVVDPQGQPLAGATVEIVHEPTGTRRIVTTDADGRYSTRGLRVGGPYTVEAEADGRSGEKQQVFLLLAETSTVDLTVASEGTALEVVEVTATASATIFTPDNMGAGTNVSREQIEAFPSISRSIQDYIRLDPRLVQTDKERGEISAGGQNTRYNNVEIDGVGTNDPFGLEANGLPALNQPISIEWIEEFNVQTSTYDSSEGDFVGARVNAVTKSGTNEFHGAVYGSYRDADMVGEDENGNEFTGFDDEWTAGAYIGGPIIQDTLFFFVGYERFERSSPAPDIGIEGQGRSTTVAISQPEIDRIISIASGLGLDPGTLGAPPIDNVDDKYIVKADWNVNDAHRLSARYNKTESSVLVLPNFGATTISLSSAFYEQQRDFENYVGTLYSDWSDVLSTEFSLSYSDYESVPLNFTSQPSVRVRTDAQNNAVFLGTEQFRHANVLDVETVKAFGAAELFFGDHTVKFGADYSEEDIYNLFVESSFGRYEFSTIDDFAARRFAIYQLRAANSNNPDDAAALWTLENVGLFVQDSWAVNYNLNLLYGLRVDTPSTDDEPTLNTVFEGKYGFANNLTVDGNSVVQPRIGFNYTFESDRPTQLRGGVGLFMGSAANVWLSNNFTNTGRSITIFQQNNGTGFSPDPDAQPRPTATQPSMDVDALAEDFEQPTVWKANLAIDHELPWWGLVASAELLLTNTENGIHYEHLNLGDATGLMPDGRLSFWRNLNATGTGACFAGVGATGSTIASGCQRSRADPRFNDVLLARNSNKGHGKNLVLSIERPFADNWYAKLAYSYTDAEEVSPLTSSRAISNWNSRQSFNPNEEEASTSNYEIQDRWTLATSYQAHFFQDYATTFSAFFEARSGKAYSYTFIGDANGDRINGNDLFYIPRAPGDVLFVNAAQEQAFFEYLESDGYLSSHRGQVAGRNDAYAPWTQQMDVRIAQELPGFFGDNKAELYFDILNFTNLLNDDWGHIDEFGFPGTRQVARVAGVDPATGRYIYQYTGTPRDVIRRDRVGESRWAVQIGFRYEF
ncbi:MAG TPA: carboxypeptidase regulatory-like domain-containing protein [Candidatus Saccharimonadia bacterium]|nr:carboxypeptidase regulatory-like domain-containing protein [Candidatus Saccharimonadia bacterium]